MRSTEDSCRHHVRAILEVLQRFRESQNTLSAFVANLSALENITVQRECLEGAVRRQEHGDRRTMHTSRAVSSDAQEAALSSVATDHPRPSLSASATDSHPLPSMSEHVATAPLGVLAAYPTSVVESLISQHAQDQGLLLQSLSSTSQAWARNMQAVAQLIAGVEMGGGVRGVCGAASPQSVKPSERKAMLQRAADALYSSTDVSSAGGAHAGAEGTPRHDGGAEVAQRQQYCEAYVAATGLPSLARLLRAAHGLLAAMTAMASVLQGCVLALRADLLRTSFIGGGQSASSAHAFISREMSAMGWAEIGRRPLGGLDEPQRLVDVLGELANVVGDAWERGCKERYLNSDALILLSRP